MVRLMFLKVKARLFPCRPQSPLPFKIYTNNGLIKTGFNLIGRGGGGGGGLIHAIIADMLMIMIMECKGMRQ